MKEEIHEIISCPMGHKPEYFRHNEKGMIVELLLPEHYGSCPTKKIMVVKLYKISQTGQNIQSIYQHRNIFVCSKKETEQKVARPSYGDVTTQTGYWYMVFCVKIMVQFENRGNQCILDDKGTADKSFISKIIRVSDKKVYTNVPIEYM